MTAGDRVSGRSGRKWVYGTVVSNPSDFTENATVQVRWDDGGHTTKVYVADLGRPDDRASAPASRRARSGAGHCRICRGPHVYKHGRA